MKKENKIVRFWPKLLSRIVDLILVASLSILASYFIFEKVAGQTQLKETWMFYVWALGTAILFLVFFILIPLVWKGKSVGNFILRVKVVSKGSLTKAILKRELAFGWAWLLLVIAFTALINHSMVLKATMSQTNIKYVGWEAVRVSVLSTLAGLIIITQMIFGVSGLVKKNGISIHDEMAGSKVVWINKFTTIEKEVTKKEIMPSRVKHNPVEWIGGENV